MTFPETGQDREGGTRAGREQGQGGLGIVFKAGTREGVQGGSRR